MEKKYKTFWSFYPYYLTEHSNTTCRTLHYIGTSLVILLVAYSIYVGKPILLSFIPLAGYGFAWLGHFVFEKNKPATFQYPFYSLASDFVMFYHFLTGQIDKKLAEAHKTVSAS